MKVQEFINIVENDNNGIINLPKVLEVKKYIPIMHKYEIARMVFEASTSIRNGLIEIDSLKKYLMFTITAISNYTNIEFSKDEAIDEYDMLCEAGLIDKIIECFEEDYARASTVLNYVFTDEIANNNTVVNVLAELTSDISNAVDSVAENLNEKIASFDGGNIDMSGIEEVMKLIGK
jgi:hypothetical protein